LLKSALDHLQLARRANNEDAEKETLAVIERLERGVMYGYDDDTMDEMNVGQIVDQVELAGDVLLGKESKRVTPFACDQRVFVKTTLASRVDPRQPTIQTVLSISQLR